MINPMRLQLSWSVWSRAGFVIAALALGINEVSKWWLLKIYDIDSRGIVTITPFFDLTLIWNKGVSYGLFQQETVIGRYFLIGITLLIAGFLVVWLMRVRSFLIAAAIGLILGGALGNVIDRIQYGAVADFFSFHFRGFYWYVFNVADIWVVAGAGLLIYDSLFNKAPNE